MRRQVHGLYWNDVPKTYAGKVPDSFSLGKMGPMVIDKSQPIESIGLRLRDHTRTFDSGVRARSNYRRTPPREGIGSIAETLGHPLPSHMW